MYTKYKYNTPNPEGTVTDGPKAKDAIIDALLVERYAVSHGVLTVQNADATPVNKDGVPVTFPLESFLVSQIPVFPVYIIQLNEDHNSVKSKEEFEKYYTKVGA